MASLDLESEGLVAHGGALQLSRKPDPDEVRLQLGRILASPRFTSSPRCQLILEYLVERSLQGNSASLKERTIGIEILKRNADYDTNADPAVRMTASEIRKKLAQYYYEHGTKELVRIELPTGSYAPVFAVAAPTTGIQAVPHLGKPLPEIPQGLPAESGLSEPPATSVRASGRFVTITSLVAFLLVLSAAVLIQRAASRPTPIQEFWAPVLKSPNPLLLYPDQLRATALKIAPVSSRTPSGWVQPRQPVSNDSEGIPVMVVEDAVTLASVVGTLHAEKKQFSSRGVAVTSYADLQKGADVLFGGFSNDWTIYLTRSMRYHFENDAEGDSWIQDQKDPAMKFGFERPSSGSRGSEQFGLVARVFVGETNQPAMIMAGLGPAGTMAAGEFVTDTHYLSDFLKTAPRGWQTKNVEIVVSANVIDNQSGPPHVVASVVW